MQRLLMRLLLLSLITSSNLYASGACHTKHYKSKFESAHCPSECCPEYPTEDFQVDNACVDFCLDYEHTLSECQKSCRN